LALKGLTIDSVVFYFPIDIIDFNTEVTTTIDTFDFWPPNWRISFTVTLFENLVNSCGVLSINQVENAAGSRYDGNFADRVPAVLLFQGVSLEFQLTPVNGGYGIKKIYSPQLNKVSQNILPKGFRPKKRNNVFFNPIPGGLFWIF